MAGATPPGAPGILCYDPNPTTAKLVAATLQLAGYQVFVAQDEAQSVAQFQAHGPAGDGRAVALLLDASADPAASASVLRALIQLPGASELPGILMVSKKNPEPIPGAEGLPSIRRPFSSPGLLKVINATLADAEARLPEKLEEPAGEREQRLATLLARHGVEADKQTVAQLLVELDAEEDLPSAGGDEALHMTLGTARLESMLQMLADDGASGVLLVERDDSLGRLHLQDGIIRLAEYRGADEDLKLGRFIVQGGFMKDEELEAFFENKNPEGKPFGTRLVEAGFISEADLYQVLTDQAREVTCHLLTWKSGKASFRRTDELHPLAKAAAKHGGVTLTVSEALLDGLRRLSEEAVMGPHMAQVDDVFMRIDEQVARLGRDVLDREELTVLELTNGRNSVKEIARRTRTGTFAVARVLYRLGKSNVVRRRTSAVTV